MLDGNELRALIRDVIATELAAAKAERNAPVAASEEHRVRIASDGDLAAFAKQVLSLAADTSVQRKIAAGTYGFKLEGAAPGGTSAAPPPSGGSARIDKGVVTESALIKLPRGTKRLLIGAEVSVTPLARDKASSLGITIERMRP